MKSLNLTEPGQGWSIFVGGMYGAGKTTFLGDMLLYEQKRGKCAYVMTPQEGNELKGGWQSIQGIGLECKSHLVETYSDLKDLMKQFRESDYQAAGLDQLAGVAKLIRIDVLGEDRMPKSSLKTNEYGEIVNEFTKFIRAWVNSSKYSVCVAPTDLTVTDDQTGKTPEMSDLPKAERYVRPMMDWAKLEFVIPGMFDLCFYLDVDGVTETRSRTLRVKQGKKMGYKAATS